MNKIVKVWMEKEYSEAKNHVAIGEVLEETPYYLRMRCKTYHFGRYKTNNNIKQGEIKVRCFPWGKIEVITELPQGLNWERASFKLVEGNIVLDDNKETKIKMEKID